eukprot:CAMPEP_0172939470 /NCGR_PEP_ID=MMETSP1075-20121228/223546_1 /TAXON_ID=2916 /ORGANISM="Ceratium fusus, Strain PA161109" /LENGTH=525 /DNA_ID=CAMNT_0013800861 /DNA_START=65 /DNA_END=1643 /DNA_ORIENTATION=+
MLPHLLIYGSIAAGLLATSIVVGLDSSQLMSIRGVFASKDGLASFQRSYLFGFFLAMLADWLQGPFVYALYQGYGIDHTHNGYLFVAGFGSSALFGTFVGSLADKYGRRKFVILYCVLFGVHCATKHCNAFGMLLLGRVLGGISTSLLFSVFDSWLVSESQRQGFDEEQLGNTFSLAHFGSSIAAIGAGQFGEVVVNLAPLTEQLFDSWLVSESQRQGFDEEQLGNTFSLAHFGSSIAAIGAGQFGEVVVNLAPLTEMGGGMSYGGYTAPFDLAIIILLLCMLHVTASWTENYGQSTAKAITSSDSVLWVIFRKKQILLCGLIACLFESSMFIFVFYWTPCLMEPNLPIPPFGHIFSGFMIWCMLGTRVYSFLASRFPVRRICLGVMMVSVFCHVTVFLFKDVVIRFLAFLVFEMMVGLYFPMMGTLKSDIVPEDLRSTIYNIYRLPMNMIVLLPLLMNFSIATTFAVTTVSLISAVIYSFLLHNMLMEHTAVAAEDLPQAQELGKGCEEHSVNDREAVNFIQFP